MEENNMADKKDNKINEEEKITNCLRNEKVNIKYIKRASDMVKDPKHVLYGGLADSAEIQLVVPMLRNGSLVNILTNNEKRFLENYMGLDEDALSIHRKKDNFWESYSVTLTKDGLVLDLSNPNDFIKYKVLKANSDFIADSLQTLEDFPKPSYRFVMTTEEGENTKMLQRRDTKKRAYMLSGKYEDNMDAMKTIIELFDHRPVSDRITLEGCLTKIEEFIAADAKRFVEIAGDKNLEFHIILRNALKNKTVYKKGDYYYLAKDGSPLCGENNDPVLSAAIDYISDPSNQKILFAIQDTK